MLRHLILLGTTSLVVLTSNGSAQAQRTQEQENRVRVMRADSQFTHGRVIAVTDSSLVLSVGRGATRELRRTDIERVDVATGRQYDKGLKNGASAGMAVGGMAGMAFGRSCNSSFMCFAPYDNFLVGAGIGILVGGVLGAILAPTEWTPASVEAMQVRILPGQGAGVTLRF